MTAATTIGRLLHASSRGQALAEMAVIAPLLLLLLVGLIEVGRYANFSILVSNAARAGVQYGAQNLVTAADNAGMQSAAIADANLGAAMTATGSHICKCADGSASTCLPTDCASSHRLVYVQVDTVATFNSMLHVAGIAPSLQIRGHAVMRAAQ